MTRKDTIIIAVFVNAAILVALFISAMRSNRSEDQQPTVAVESTQKVVDIPLAKTDNKADPKSAEPVIAKNEIKSAEGDEVDLVLKQFAQSAPAIAATPTPSETVATAQAPALDFAADLQTFTPAASEGQNQAIAAIPAALIDVTVKKGDALEKIARAHRTTVKDIMRINNLSNANLHIGQVLKVSPGTRKTATTSAAAAKSEGPKYYTVKAGDNPWTIAVKNHMKLEELLKLNNLDQDKARRLKAGDKLRIK